VITLCRTTRQSSSNKSCLKQRTIDYRFNDLLIFKTERFVDLKKTCTPTATKFVDNNLKFILKSREENGTGYDAIDLRCAKRGSGTDHEILI